MTTTNWTEADSNRAVEIWSNYQERNDVTQLTGKTAGIDPVSGKIWIGESIQDVVAQRDSHQSTAPLYFIRVGSATYYRKGGHR